MTDYCSGVLTRYTAKTGGRARAVRVEVGTGIVTGAMMHGRTTRWLPELIGKRRYWIDLVEADGGRLGVWDGDSEADALREAETIRADWGIAAPVAIVGKEGGNVH